MRSAMSLIRPSYVDVRLNAYSLNLADDGLVTRISISHNCDYTLLHENNETATVL